MANTKEEDLVAVARLGAPRGLHGFLRLHSYSGEYDHIKTLKDIILASESKPDSGRKATIRAFETGDWGVSAAFEGYDSPERARELTGMNILVPRSRASPLKDNEWYISDLVGMQLVLGDSAVGTIEGVLEGGPDPLLEVRLSDSGKTVLVPFRNEFIGTVDSTKKYMKLLAGWLLE